MIPARAEAVPFDKAAEPVKLLLVDDDNDNLLALQAILEPLGQALYLAHSGADALRLCLDHDFAAILLDVRMPDLDGFETAELVRSRKRSRQTPILFLTAYRSDEQLFRGYDMGAVDFLFKPIVPEILQSKVSVFVQVSQTAQRLKNEIEERAQAEQRFRTVLEVAPDAMIVSREDGVIELANSSAATLFTVPPQSLVGKDIRTLIPEWTPNGDPLAALEKRFLALRFTGVHFAADITRSPLVTPDGTLIITAIRDATEQVEAEGRAHRLNLELERRVALRTRELTQSNEALQQFAWAVSHDLQEPVRTLLSYSQWLSRSLEDSLGGKEERMLRTIVEHAGRMHQLMAALRQYLHIGESGRQEWTEVDCNNAVRTALSTLQGMIDETGALVRYQNLPTICCIEILLIQLFQNLISNGIKYRSSEPPVIEISAEPGDRGWCFRVRDNGIGIDPKYFDQIFGVFKRLHGGQYSGTGIGLAICKAAIDSMGGRIWVDSAEGAGTSFYFFIPERTDDHNPESSHLSG